MDRKIHLITWEVILKEKSKGGLGLRGMRQLNSAFLMKLGWRFLAEPSTLWTRVLREKYCQGRELESTVTRPATCSNA